MMDATVESYWERAWDECVTPMVNSSWYAHKDIYTQVWIYTLSWLYAYVHANAHKSGKGSPKVNYNWIWAAVNLNLNLMSPNMKKKNFTNLFENIKTKVEAFIFTKMKHTHIAVTPIGN